MTNEDRVITGEFKRFEQTADGKFMLKLALEGYEYDPEDDEELEEGRELGKTRHYDAYVLDVKNPKLSLSLDGKKIDLAKFLALGLTGTRMDATLFIEKGMKGVVTKAEFVSKE